MTASAFPPAGSGVTAPDPGTPAAPADTSRPAGAAEGSCCCVETQRFEFLGVESRVWRVDASCPEHGGTVSQR